MEASTSFEKVENKTLKLEQEEEVDRISALPDSILQHILSYLPSTKEAIRTSVLSKRWKNQWSGVSNLIFDSTGMSDEQSLSFIDTTLIQHGCYNIKKFQIRLDGRNVNRDAHLYEKIHFSIKRHVEELILEFPHCNIELPPFLFNHPPLVKLQTLGCTIVPNDRINWERLKELSMMRCKLPDDMVESILSCCPLLDLLSLSSCFGFGRLIVASDSLKKLELIYLHSISVLEISCPNLEEFWLHGYIDVMATTFKNLSSLIRANLAFEHEMEDFEGSSVKEILEQLQHVEELTYGCQLLEAILWDFDWQPDLSPLSLKNKCLTFDSPDFKAYSHSGAIKYALLSSPFLEKLVITKEAYIEFAGDSPVRMSQREHYWSRVESDFKCLKFVQFIGLPDDDQDYTLVLDFLGFLLKNSRVLEKLVVTLQDGGRDFENEVSEILLSFPRCSAHAFIEVLGSHRIVTNI